MENDQKTAIQEMDETAKRRKDEKLAEAIKIVNEAIRAEREEYEKIAKTEEQEPILLVGETCRGVIVHAMVDPKGIAKIFLNYDYPMIHVLEQEPPQGMWDDIARLVGLEAIESVDL